MEEMLQVEAQVDVQELKGLEVLWGWHPLEQQTDAADFLHSLSRLARTPWMQGSMWTSTPTGPEERSNQVPFTLPFSEERGDTDLDDLITQWANEGLGSCFRAGQKILVVQIDRFQRKGRQWVKHHKRQTVG